VRIEWYGDEVDTLRTFDPITQRTLEMRQQAVIPKAREMIWTKDQRQRAMTRIADESAQLIHNLESVGQLDQAVKARERFGHYLHDLSEDRAFPGIDRFAAAFGTLVPLTETFVKPR